MKRPARREEREGKEECGYMQASGVHAGSRGRNSEKKWSTQFNMQLIIMVLRYKSITLERVHMKERVLSGCLTWNGIPEEDNKICTSGIWGSARASAEAKCAMNHNSEKMKDTLRT